MTYSIDIVIPAYRAEATIARAILSVLHQKDVKVRIIVVVDGDVDLTAERASVIDDRVQVVVNPRNLGGQASRNLGLSSVEAPYVMFLDSDDFVEGELLSGLCATLASTKSDFALGPWRAYHEARSAYGAIIVPDYRTAEELFYRWLAKTHFVPPCAIAWRTEFVRDIGGWKPSLLRNQDGELVMRAALLGGRFVCSNSGNGVYVQSPKPESITARSDNLVNMLDAPALLLASPSIVLDQAFVRRTIAQHYFNVADYCFRRGNTVVGKAAVRLCRELGGAVEIRGSRKHRMLVSVFGLANRYLLRRLRRRLFNPDLRQDK